MDTHTSDKFKKLAEAGEWDKLKQELREYFEGLPNVQVTSAEQLINTVVSQAQLSNAIFVPLLERVDDLYTQLAELDKVELQVNEAVAKHQVRQQLKD